MSSTKERGEVNVVLLFAFGVHVAMSIMFLVGFFRNVDETMDSLAAVYLPLCITGITLTVMYYQLKKAYPNDAYLVRILTCTMEVGALDEEDILSDPSLMEEGLLNKAHDV